MKLLRKGKVKEVYEVSDEELEFLFTDNISVFDKIIPSQIPHKGETLCRTSAFWFQIASTMGINNHLLEVLDGNRMRVKRVRVIRDYSQITPETRGYLIPMEWVARYYVAGSLYDRLRAGNLDPKDLGFTSGHRVEYGERLPEPYLEVTTKLEKVDRLLTRDEALEISGLTPGDFDAIWEVVLSLDRRMDEEVRKRNLIHVDGKKEFAMDEERSIMVVDTFGTADEDRFWDGDQYQMGRFVELSKEFVRQHYRNEGYFDLLYEARDLGKPEPDIPALPEEMVRKVSDLYVSLYERITGLEF
ncbi:MAG: phosphoribosylaminoimidazolesuccinocarboxamide synthase [Thermoplasmata archaeon]